MVLNNLFLVAAYSVLIYLNHKGYYDIPKFLLILCAITPVFVVSGMVGIEKSHLHFSMIPLAGVSVLMFDRKEKWKIIVAMGYPLILLLILITADLPLFPNLMGNKLDMLPTYDYFLNFGVIFASMFCFYHFYITTEDRLNEEQARAIYASKMAALGEMAGAIAHEINNPLFLISSYSTKLKDCALNKTISEEDLVKYSSTIEETCKKMNSIIRSLSSFSRASESDPIVKTSIRELINDVMVLCHHRYYLKSIHVEVDLEENLPLALCRPVQVGQILVNLLNNAYDAVANRENPRVRLQAKSHGEKLVLTVEDNGSGISADIKDRIFETFYTTKGVGKGTGLGLSISKKIAESNHGSLTFTSLPGKTSFYLELPGAKDSF